MPEVPIPQSQIAQPKPEAGLLPKAYKDLRPQQNKYSLKEDGTPDVLRSKPDAANRNAVKLAVEQAKRHGERVPNTPEATISTYLESLVGKHGLLGGSEERRQRQIAHHVIKPHEIPESYFANQVRLAREQGHGDIIMTPELRKQHAQIIIAEQTKSLEAWVDYINHPDANYPAWFRYFTMRSVLTLGKYHPEGHEFQKRSQGTTAPYPELNREALAYVYDTLTKSLQGLPTDEVDNARLQTLLQTPNFGKFYAYALEKSALAHPETRNQTAGVWVKYDQGSDEAGKMRAKQLSDSLQGHGTGWCTAGEQTAQSQVAGGDFYVYYSYDEQGKATIPRVAIRMEREQVAEARGISKDQEMEPAMIDIAQEKLAALPGGETYHQKVADMKLMTALETKQQAGEPLTITELRFLYEIDRKIQGFGYKNDPRIEDIRSKRNVYQDGAAIFDCLPEEIAVEQREMSERTIALLDNLNATGYSNGLPKHLRYVRGNVKLNHARIPSLGNLQEIGGDVFFGNSEVTDLGHLRRIGGAAYFARSQVTSLGELEYIGKTAIFSSSQVSDLGNLQEIGENAEFMNATVTSLGHLKKIGGNALFLDSYVIDLSDLQEIGGMADFTGSKVTSLGHLKKIGGDAYFTGSDVTDLGHLQRIGGDAYFTRSQVPDLGNLQEIGGDAEFIDSKVASLGHLRRIGGAAYFNRSQVTDLGDLQEIGGNAEFMNATVTSLGHLKKIGGRAFFPHSQVTDLGDLQEIGGDAEFIDSKVASLGNLQKIGRDVWANEYVSSKRLQEICYGRVFVPVMPNIDKKEEKTQRKFIDKLRILFFPPK